ncbi:MAG TPA: hypothetical protein VFD43_04210, partial [Planctomycetota bacterium]|nr:hypothetical protein [Planctomycetota bacterium]
MPSVLAGRPGLRPARALLPSCVALALAACAIAPPPVAPEADISAATGLAGAVSFRVDGSPLDELPSAGESLTL